MVKFLVVGLVQIFIYLLDLFNDQGRFGVVEDAREALRLVLSVLDQMLSGEHLIQESTLAWSCDMYLLEHVLEMIVMEAVRIEPWLLLACLRKIGCLYST